MRRAQRAWSSGYTLVEVACAFAVLGVLATTVYLGEAGQLHGVARSFRDTAAAGLVAGRLEQIIASDAMPEPGQSSFDVPTTGRLQKVRGVQTVREVRPGLFEVTARLHWVEQDRPRELRMSTMVAKKGRR